jgi:exodeoxyribonuclease V alpha subunit
VVTALAELTDLGYRDPNRTMDLTPTPVGTLNRNDAVERVLARLAAGGSAWNAADIRGEAEQLLAASGIVADAAVRTELAEDLTTRTLERCLPLLPGDGVPEHIRAWTSRPVLAVEADLTTRFCARSTGPDADAPQTPLFAARAAGRLDAGQAAAVVALAGDGELVVVEGAAGAGKTTTLAAIGDLLAAQGRWLVVVTPTLKAAKVAATEVGAPPDRRHGWPFSTAGAGTRTVPGPGSPSVRPTRSPAPPTPGPRTGAAVRR